MKETKKTNLNLKKNLAIMAITSFWSAVIMAAILGVISHFWPIPEYTIPIINLTISRWWDVLFLPVHLNLILSVFLFLIPYLDKNHKIDKGDLKNRLAIGLAFGLAAGLIFGLEVEIAVGLTSGLAAGLVFGLAIGLAAGLVFGPAIVFVIGILWLAKKVIDFHKWILKNL